MYTVVLPALGIAAYVAYRALRSITNRTNQVQNSKAAGSASTSGSGSGSGSDSGSGSSQRSQKREIAVFLQSALALEAEQTEQYRTQAKEIRKSGIDYHLAAALDRMADIEKEHYQAIADYLRGMGVKPLALAGLGPVAGKALGLATAKTDIKNVARTVVWTEQKAIDHYLQAYQRFTDPALRDLLLRNLIDEELHAAWAQEYLEQCIDQPEQDTF